jgi:6-phosphogluconolactonase
VTTRSRISLRVVKDRDELRRAAAEIIARKIHSAVQARGVCSLALSGGSTPGPVYEELGNSDLAAKIPWARLEIFFADERAVPMDHPESNYRLVMETLLKSHPEAVGQTFRMPADAPDREQAAKRYERRLPDPIDVLVLGMGPDGHTASLFPGSPALDEQERRVVPVTAPKPPPERMTITPPVVKKARSTVMIVSGVEKAHMVSRVLSGLENPRTVPAVLAEKAHWILDHAAAGNVLNP